jgi:hypothetical protein
MAAPLIDRLAQVVTIHEELLPLHRSRIGDPAHDGRGTETRAAAGSLRTIAVSRFVLGHDAAQFRQMLAESVTLVISLFDRAKKGEPIDESYLTVLEYQSVLDALAAQRFELATQLASHLKGCGKLDRKYCHRFDRAIGYALLAVLTDSADAERLSSKFVAYFTGKGNKSLHGYASFLLGTANRDAALVNDSVQEILRVHKRLSSTSIFKLEVDEVLCVWGIGLCNLALSKGIDVRVDHPLIPARLLIASHYESALPS